jgi:hypothetical protein
MTFIVKNREKPPVKTDPKPGTGDYSNSNPAYRKAYGETMEQIKGLTPREMSPVRRFVIKKTRFQGKTPELIAEAAAIRAAMSKEINR